MIACIAVGVILGIGLAFLIWQIFQMVLSNLGDMSLGLSFTGVAIGLIFGLVSMVPVLFQLYRFVQRTDMMDILYHEHKNEPLRPVTTKYGISGFVLLVVGLLLGFGGPLIGSSIGILLPSIWSATYLISLAGLYRIMTYAIMKSKRGRNPQKYYNDLIGSNMMKFQGRQTVRNMSIVALLLTASLFSCFYPPQLYSALNTYGNSPVDYELHYNLSEDEVNQQDLYRLAEKHDVEIKEYQEIIFSELIASGVERDWSDDGKLMEDYIEDYRLSDFIDASTFNQQTKHKLVIPEGQYYRVKGQDEAEGMWEKDNDLDHVTNPVTNEKLPLKFKGIVRYQPLVSKGSRRYILNDQDYLKIRTGLSQENQTKQILFNVTDVEDSYPFAQEVYQEFIEKASPKMAVHNPYDAYQSAKAKANHQDYGYDRKLPFQWIIEI